MKLFQSSNQRANSREYQIQNLDPQKNHCEIYHLTTGYEFPWDTVKALELALMKTFCIPSISRLLDKTGEFHHRPQKRYDDTAIIVSEISKWGYDSDRGLAAIARMNEIHGRFRIANEDFIYVLSTFICEPIRWNERFGWRKMSEQEKLATFYFWSEVGKRMQIMDIPPTYAELMKFNQEYEAKNFVYSDANRRVGESTRDLFLSWFPPLIRPLLKPATSALFDSNMLNAFGFPEPPVYVRSLVENTLKIKGRIVRYLPQRKQSDFFIDKPTRTYPNGYEIHNLGADRN